MTRLPLIAFAAAAVGLFAPAGAALAQSPSDSAVTLTFETGARTGAVMVALYDSEAGYAGDRPVGGRRLDVAAGEHTVTFEGLPAGDYAAKAFHDVNGDGEMNTNPFGMPVEPYAFSNNAVGNMGPASWERARFAVSGPTAQTISIR
ncbi:MAG: DUF2141 domain-containing protein [Brevundimonas sp.]|uniref:DUF2141 domain-containing protein n=1 Tax=Brevundimonas sp. TaxID=1871086 RepID=UPI0026365857|nr:DUF2141 domain-containing protein [Brevundimonas sp.]MDI6624625.1 DUF2141 domain-containing protein [Brevundimonas sp.]MDQ7813272.1 DUF2141 domain-containing protein [Brevundimonas sp.]